MLKLPIDFENQMKSQLGLDYDDFLKALNSESPTSIRINKIKDQSNLHLGLEKVSWTNDGYYLEQRPSFTFDPKFHAGHYYVQEASSMFIEQAIKQCVDLSESIMALDLCAAPGGKSTHISSLISEDSLLISNEVIASRASILVENLSKWGNANTIVTNNDPEHFQSLNNCFDLVILDAPCSGEGMFRKDHDSINEWNVNNVNICSARQMRILHTASELVMQNGIIIYSTCTYNSKEDIEPVMSLLNEGGWESVELDIKQFEGIVLNISNHPKKLFGYHFYPHKIKGEGFYLTVLRKSDESNGRWPKVMKNVNFADKQTKPVLAKYIDQNKFGFLQHNQQSLAFPKSLEKEMLGILNTSLRIKKFGIEMGQVIRGELVPEHAYAMANINEKPFDIIQLNKEDAIKYLQKKDFQIDTNLKGWCLLKYDDAVLGFAKLMGNRMNNNYPKEWRIKSEKELL
ncbi:MAG: methyltransferase RsmF C-terminal domain-like protein [bacterium]|jgi:16S rRNA C967 or C1407 C5-methylase (RsmB/RsmF family)/NOL1/NOP2/fmu family ribosome biogenesis protein